MESTLKDPLFRKSPSRRIISLLQDREKLDTWCEWGILGLILAILAYSPLALGSVRPQEFVVVEWLTTAVLALWVCRFWLNPKHRLLWPPVCWGVLAFMVYAVIRYLTADVEYVARQETIKVLVYGFLFLAILHNCYHLERVQLIGLGLIGLAMVIAMYALGQFLTESDHIWWFIRPTAYHKRGSGTFFCPNHLAGYLEMLLPLALAYALASRLPHLHKILIGYAALAIFGGIVVSVSVGGWIATGATLIIFFVWLMRWRDYRMQAILMGVGLAVIGTTFILNAELSPNRLRHLSAAFQADDIRPRLWQPAIQMWQDSFWFGTGPGHYDLRFPQYRPEGEVGKVLQIRPLWAHNDYLNTLADWGTIGGVLVLVAWGLFFWSVFRSWKFLQRAQNDLVAKRSNKSSFVFGGVLGLVAILLHSVVDFNMHIPSNAILTVTIMALVSAHFRYATEKHWHTVRLPMRLLVTVVLLAGVAYLGAQSWHQTKERFWLSQANRAGVQFEDRIAALEKAFAAAPANSETAYQLGETYRIQSWDGEENSAGLAEKALGWFERASVLNAYDLLVPIGQGMCLDWLRRHEEAANYFEKALKLDPHGYYTLAHVGRHYANVAEYAKSKEYLKKSIFLRYSNNPIARGYLEIVNRRLAENPK